MLPGPDQILACPKCGKPLSEAPVVWRPRGEWMCHEDHDGKRIWWNYELTMILRARLREANDPSSAAKSRDQDA